MAKDKPLTAKSSVGDWLKHPVGGPLLRDLLAQGGQSEKALAPVRLLSLQRLVAMSNGQFPQAMVDDLVAKAERGETPAGGVATPAEAGAADASDEFPDEDEVEVEEWEEQVTPGRFAGKTVIVTGAASGIGRATASRVAREGGRVIAVDISADRLTEFAASLPDADISTVAGDITKAEDIERIVAAAGERIDALANVAGIMDDFTPIHEVSDAVWDRVFAVNVTGMMKLTRAVVPAMLAAHRGSIVNVASEAALRGSAAGVAYTASKHAVVGITKSSALMYGASGIRVNAVAPGPVATGIQASFSSPFGQERLGGFMASIPPVAVPEQLAASITFLLSDDGTNVSGAILPSDGAWSVQ
ncbi:MAG TPA: SDR family NAD(P)-dependent oxidoreductase [Naasia sp.]|jgi:NAD(P)-dependent dehydrogenase (short-subunit alcohol dehydrogenase family)